MVDLLLGLGILVYSFNGEGRTALQCAVEHQSVSAVQLLIERKAKVNLRSPILCHKFWRSIHGINSSFSQWPCGNSSDAFKSWSDL